MTPLSAMDRCLDIARQRKKSLLLISAAGLATYGCYKLYHTPSIAKKSRRLVKILGALVSIAESVSNSAESISLVSRDLTDFLRSDSDEIPTSLKQISKIARSEELSASMVKITEALTVGILRGYNSVAKIEGDEQSSQATHSSFSDRILDKVFSPAGSGFASVVVGSFARSLVTALYSEHPNSPRIERPVSDFSPQWMSVVCSEKCRELIADCIQLFVSTAVAVYLDKTMDINTYDEIFSGLTNPKHESKVKNMLVSVCSGAVETLVKTSHQVLTNPNVNSSLNSDLNSVSCRSSDKGKSGSFEEDLNKNSFEEVKDSGWIDKVSTSLAVPSNRKFVLDVTGRVTFETVRSFLDFLTWKMSDGLKRSLTVVHGEAAERGLQVVRYVGAKSVLIATICIALCLHILVGTRALMPASVIRTG